MVPLSDHEQKILEEIERNLHEEDPRLAREVGSSRRVARADHVKWGLLLFAAGFAVLIGFFASGVLIVGVAAFGVMVAGIVIAAAGVGVAPNLRQARPRERFATVLSQWENRLRERYKRR